MANALDTRRISHGSPYDVRNRSDVWQGMKDAYLNAIQAMPEWFVGQMAPEVYTPGVIASTPKDRIRAAQMHREQNIAQRRQDIGRDYEQGMDYGTALGMIADPYIDLPLAGVAKLAQVGKLGRSQAKPFNALSDLAGERGAIDLPSGEAARLQRAEELGFTTDAYSGSTHKFDEFRGDLANPESDWGRGSYASTSIEDVNKNYAGIGPDLTNRIERKAEEVADYLADDPEYLLDQYDITMSEYLDDEAAVAQKIAHKELTGEADGGMVYPLKINTKNYAKIGGDNPTRLTEDTEVFDDLARSEIDKADYEDLDDYEDAVNERIWELKADDPDALSVKVNNALRESDIWQDDNYIQEIIGELDDELMEGDLTLSSLDDAIRRHVVNAYDDNGDMISSGEISSQVLKSLGFDGVVDTTVYRKFGAGRQYGTGMEGIAPDTAHIVTFPGREEKIRSRFAKFDPSKKTSRDLLATGALGTLGYNALKDR